MKKKYKFIFYACLKYYTIDFIQDAELLKILDEAYEEAWENAHNNDGWKEEKKSDEGDIVYSKKNKKGKK